MIEGREGTVVATWAACVLSLALLTSCSEKVAYYCCSTKESCEMAGGNGEITPCLPRYPDRPFCDDLGQYPASEGIGRTCIPTPFDGGPIGCTSPDECTAQTPVCDTAMSLCVGCSSETDCSGRYPATPHCGDTGACVECRDSADCSPSEPVCEASSSTCRTCEADDECASGICDETTGACIDETNIIFVNSTSGAPGTCTKAVPCKTIGQGVTAVNGARKWLLVAPATYGETVVIKDVSVNIIANGATVTPSTNGLPGLDIKGSAVVLIEGLKVALAGNAQGISCAVDGGKSPALTIRRSNITGNTGGGIKLDKCDFAISNTFITKNGIAGSSGFGGIKVIDGPPSGATAGRLDFVTIAGNGAQAAFNSGVDCSGVVAPLVFTNSIVYGNMSDSQVGGPNCSWTFSDIGPQAIAGNGNINMPPMFVNANMGDYHLVAGSPGINVADPNASEKVDFDGDERPQAGRADMGADEVK